MGTYNRRDSNARPNSFCLVLSFYHDKGGLTAGIGTFVDQLKTGLCGKPTFRLRREGIPETVKVYPLQKNGGTYGAVLSGENYL